MKLFVREEASADLEAIFDWISRDNPGAAASVVSRIRRRFHTLLTPGLAHMGRPGRDPGTRELIEGSYIIVYEVHQAADEIDILAVLHGARDRDRMEPR